MTSLDVLVVVVVHAITLIVKEQSFLAIVAHMLYSLIADLISLELVRT